MARGPMPRRKRPAPRTAPGRAASEKSPEFPSAAPPSVVNAAARSRKEATGRPFTRVARPAGPRALPATAQPAAAAKAVTERHAPKTSAARGRWYAAKAMMM